MPKRHTKLSIASQKKPVTRWHGLSRKNKLRLFGGETRMWLDAHECDVEFVEHLHVWSRRCLRRRKGPAVLERDLQEMDGRKIDWGHGLWNPWGARDEIFAPCLVVKQKHDAVNIVFDPYLKIRSNDHKDFAPKMTFFRTFKISWEFGMCSKKPQILGPN